MKETKKEAKKEAMKDELKNGQMIVIAARVGLSEYHEDGSEDGPSTYRVGLYEWRYGMPCPRSTQQEIVGARRAREAAQRLAARHGCEYRIIK